METFLPMADVLDELVGDDLTALQKFAAEAMAFLVEYSFQILAAILILIVGWAIAAKIGRLLTNLCLKKGVDVTLSHFLGSILKFVLLFFVLLIVLDKVGVRVTPFIAALGAGAFGLSLAVQGPISNFGSGVVIIFTRMFVVGDTVKIQECCGVVEEVRLGFTRLRTEDDELVTIPNRHIVGEVLVNSNTRHLVEGVVGVAYGTDMELAVDTVGRAVGSVERVMKEPVPQVGIEAFGDSSVNIGYRYWVPSMDYHPVRYEVNRAVHDAIRKAGITIPFPQRDIHVKDGKI